MRRLWRGGLIWDSVTWDGVTGAHRDPGKMEWATPERALRVVEVAVARASGAAKDGMKMGWFVLGMRMDSTLAAPPMRSLRWTWDVHGLLSPA